MLDFGTLPESVCLPSDRHFDKFGMLAGPDLIRQTAASSPDVGRV